MNERRQITRWEINKEVKFLTQQTQFFSHCIIEDMHLNGMSVSFKEKLIQPQAVSMSFEIGEGSVFIKIEAQIPWAKEEGGRYVYGLSFSKIDDNDKNRIYRYITTNCYDQFSKNRWAESAEG